MSGDLKIKTAAGKPDLALIPLTALYGIARVFGYGAKKYERDNWKLAKDADAPRRYLSAILRHAAGMQHNPLAVDDESGLPHVYHLGCSVVMLIGLLHLHHGAPFDPGEGKEPPVAAKAETNAERLDRLAANPPLHPNACHDCGYIRCICRGFVRHACY